MTLADEITNDPEGLGYAQHVSVGNTQAIAAILNAPRYPTVGGQHISSASLLIWAGADARYDRIRAASTDHAVAEIRSIASAALGVIQRDGTSLNLALPEIGGMLAAMQAAGVMTASDVASLQALSTRDISRAEQLGLGTVTIRDVREAI